MVKYLNSVDVSGSSVHLVDTVGMQCHLSAWSFVPNSYSYTCSCGEGEGEGEGQPLCGSLSAADVTSQIQSWANGLKASIGRFGTIGVKVELTELDVSIGNPSIWATDSSYQNPPEWWKCLSDSQRYEIQAVVYETVAQVVHDKGINVTIWTLDNHNSWYDTEGEVGYEAATKEAYDSGIYTNMDEVRKPGVYGAFSHEFE